MPSQTLIAIIGNVDVITIKIAGLPLNPNHPQVAKIVFFSLIFYPFHNIIFLVIIN